MAVNYQKKIVTDGLVLCLDATDIKSYSGTGTTWYDRSGNGNNGTLGNTEYNNGAIVFNKSNSYVRAGSPSTPSYNTFTYNAWIYSTNNNGYRTIIDQGNDDWLLTVNNGQIICYDPTFNSGYFINLNQWYNVSITHVNGGPVLFYVNGSLVYTSSNTSITHTSFSYFGIGAGMYLDGSPDPEVWSGNISQASIYNRALSQSEILQNYNAQKGRYGL